MTLISMVASGSRGDVQPYIALGVGLKRAGFRVRLLTSDDFSGLVTDAGLEFASTGFSVEALVNSDEWREVIGRGNFLTIVRKMNAAMKTQADQMAATLPALIAGSDRLIAGLSGLGGAFTIADHLGIPFTPAYLMPITPTREQPGPLTPQVPAFLNQASYLPLQQMLWQTARVGEAALRRQLGLRRPPFFGPFAALERRRIPTLYGYSAHVLPRPADWAPHHHVTGYWFLNAPDGWAPPDDLARFLEAGPPPVYIGFGSMGNRDPEATARLALDALQRSKQRGVLASGWGGLKAADLPESVYMLRAAPHDWLFPRMAAVVHHGGAGTTAAGFRAGVPTIITPFFGDQPFWGARAAALGVGPTPIPRKRLTSEHLAAAITRAVSDPTLRAKAAVLGQQLRAEDGSARAAALLAE